MGDTWALVVTELRRHPQLCYKSDIIAISGLDEGDRRALDSRFRGFDPPCQVDPEDGRFVLKGPRFNPMDVINVLTKDRGYKVQLNPQQHPIPLKSGTTDDKFCMIYHLNKPIKLASDEPPPPPPQRFDSLAAMTSPGGTSRGPPPDLTSQISDIDIT